MCSAVPPPWRQLAPVGLAVCEVSPVPSIAPNLSQRRDCCSPVQCDATQMFQHLHEGKATLLFLVSDGVGKAAENPKVG